MAQQTSYFVVAYDTEAGGPYTAEGVNLTWPGGAGFIVTLVDDGTTGKLFCALVSGVLPTDAQVLTQGGVTANADGAGQTLLFPAYYRNDSSITSAGLVDWTGPALGATHSFFWDGQTANCVVGEILTFSPGGEQCEIVTIESDAGASGEFSVRWMSFIDQTFPDDNDTFTGDIAGDGTLNGVVHDRCYTPLHEHRLLSYLNTNGDIVGDDDLSRVDAIPSGKDTPEIVNLLSNITNTDTMIQHMYAGSIGQLSGDTLYAGLNFSVTSPLATTQPIFIADDGVVTDYWKNAYMPHSIDGNIRILQKVREDGVDIDGKRVKGKLNEFSMLYFEAGTTLGEGTTGLALIADNDGNNQTAVGTVAGAPYNTVVQVEGLQNLDYLDGSGATPFGYSIDYGSASALQTYERSKYIQRRGTAETLFGRGAALYSGINRNWAYDAEAGGPYTQSEILAWGTVITYSGQATNLTVGEVVNFVGTGAKGRLIYMDDVAATGTLIFAMEPGITPLTTDTLSGVTSGGDGDVDTVDYNTIFGTALLIALDDQGAAGNLYVQILTGLTPLDNQAVFGATSGASSDVNGAPVSRTINKQYMGDFTGANFQTLFGMATHPSDAIVNDLERNLLGASIGPPDNRVGIYRGGKAGDTLLGYPWDGAATDANGNAEPDYNEMTLATALVAATSTQVDVGTGNIPDNTPAAGYLRIQRDSDNNLDYIEYSAHNGDDIFTLVGTAPNNAAIANTVMRALFETVLTIDGDASYNAVYSGTPNSVVLQIKNPGGLNGPIKANVATSAFPFDVNASRISDA